MATQRVMVSVRDAKSEVYGNPFFAPSVGAAIRSFDDEVNRNEPGNILNSHPEDFSLFQLGAFNDSEGTFEIITPKLLVHGKEVKRSAIVPDKKVSRI